MLSWVEEVTSTANLHLPPSRFSPLMSDRISGPTATVEVSPSSPLAATKATNLMPSKGMGSIGSTHCNFGIDLINQIKLENPLLWTADFKAEIKSLFETSVDLEYRSAEDARPRGVLGINASMFKGYPRYIANRRATQIGLEALFLNEGNPFPWMSEMIDLKKERNFFETRVIEYQSGGALSWE